MLRFESTDGRLIGIEGQGRLGGSGQVVLATEGRTGEFGVVGGHHQRFEIDHVERVIGE